MSRLRAAVIGLGVGEAHADAYASDPRCELVAVCDRAPERRARAAQRFPGVRLADDADELLRDPDIDLVSIATYDDAHFAQTIHALEARKHVFVEKPLCLTRDELEKVRAVHANSGRVLMVGFNRRFAPLVVRMKQLIDRVAEPKVFSLFMNAGAIPASHWTQDREVGGGRIIGEACHLVDLMRFLAGAPITSIEARRMGDNVSQPLTEDKALITLGFADGSFGTVHYLSNGGASFPKERVEMFAAGRTLQLDNYLSLRGYNWPGFRKKKLWRQDKGQNACAAAFLSAITEGRQSPIPADELFEVAEATISATERLRAQV